MLKFQLLRNDRICGKCKKETLINAKNFKISVIKRAGRIDAEPINL
ncbi:cysteine-rich KTR domain-containing protein [Flintibacter sp. P01028]|nr:cysteine-rich KTR domain-containing protein [Enterocloster citroniae]